MATLADYADRYPRVAFDRTDGGVLTVRLHTGGDTLLWTPDIYRELVPAFRAVAEDPDNEVVVLTGSGDAFIGHADVSGMGSEGVDPTGFDPYYWGATRLATAFLDISAPVIAAVNGPHRVHTELSLLADVVLAAEGASWYEGHVPFGVVPGDGAHAVWQEVLGPIRANYFLWTGQVIDAGEGLRLGVCNEVLPAAGLLPRAGALAEELLRVPKLTRRYTRELLAARWRPLLRESTGYGMALEGLSLVSGRPRG